MPNYALRSMIVAKRGYTLIMCDLSQAETWIVAFLSGQEEMKKSLLYGDIHTDTAGAIFCGDVMCEHNWMRDKQSKEKQWRCEHDCTRINGEPVLVTEIMRYSGKKCNHAYAYDMGPDRNAQVINKESDQPPYVTVTVKETKLMYDAWHRYYYKIKPWHNDTQAQLGNNRTLITPYGRERVFYAGWGKELFKEAYAYVPQSTVADHFNGAVQPELGIKGGLIEVKRQIVDKSNGDIKICNQSHDSLIAEVPTQLVNELAPQITSILYRPLVVNNEQFTIPVDVEVGERWGELIKWQNHKHAA